MLKARFISAYQGAAHYEVGGRRYGVRRWASDDGHYTDFAGDIVPYVGTVRCEHPVGEFPPPEVLELFPGFVGARYDHETGRVEYHPHPPAWVWDPPYLRAAFDHLYPRE